MKTLLLALLQLIPPSPSLIPAAPSSKTYEQQQSQLSGPPQVAPLNSVPPNPTAEWTEDAPDLQTAQRYIYKYHLNGATVGAAFAGVQCAGTVSPWTCHAPLPVTIGGTHTIYITVTDVVEGVEYVSPPSSTTTFTIELLGAPTAPNPVVIIK